MIATSEEHTEGLRAGIWGRDLVAYRTYIEREEYPDTGSTWTELWLTPLGDVGVCLEALQEPEPGATTG